MERQGIKHLRSDRARELKDVRAPSWDETGDLRADSATTNGRAVSAPDDEDDVTSGRCPSGSLGNVAHQPLRLFSEGELKKRVSRGPGPGRHFCAARNGVVM